MAYAFPFDQNLHGKETLCIYTAELPLNHWNHACRVRVIFKLLLVTTMTRDRSHQNAFARASLTLLQSPIMKLKGSTKRGKEERGEGDSLVLWSYRRQKWWHRYVTWEGAALNVSAINLTITTIVTPIDVSLREFAKKITTKTLIFLRKAQELRTCVSLLQKWFCLHPREWIRRIPSVFIWNSTTDFVN